MDNGTTGHLFPTMSLAGVQARHTWLDSQMKVIGFAPLQNESTWNSSGLLLSQAVHQVVQEFQIHSPRDVQIMDPNLRNIQRKSPPTNGNHPHNSKTSSRSHPPPPPPPLPDVHIDLPPIPTRFGQVESMEREQLDKLLQDDDELQVFMNQQIPVMQEMLIQSCGKIEDNATTARQHLQYETELKELHNKATALQQELKDLVKEFTTLEAQQDAICKPPDRRKIIRDLMRAKKEAMQQSDRLADEWLEGGTEQSVDQFLKVFLDLRTKHHARAAKLEILEAGR